MMKYFAGISLIIYNMIRKLLFTLIILFTALGVTAREEVVMIPDGKADSIYGVLSRPDVGEPVGVAIICHGFSGTHKSGRGYFGELNDAGFAVYTFDFPCGSQQSRTNSNTLEMSVLDEVRALKNIVSYFRCQQWVDKDRIVLIGESQGGLVAALAASELKEQVSRLVLMFPAFCIPDNWNQRYPDASDIPEVTHVWKVPVGRRFFMELRDMDVYKVIGQYPGKVLIIQGEADAIVPADYARRAIKVYCTAKNRAHDDARLVLIDKAGHGFNPFERSIAMSYVVPFIH